MERTTGLQCRLILQRVWFTYRRRPTGRAHSLSSLISFTNPVIEIPESCVPAWARPVPHLPLSGRFRLTDNTSRLSLGIPSLKRNVGALRVVERSEAEPSRLPEISCCR